MRETTFAQAVATAKERKAIGATDVYLGEAPLTDLNWDYCTGFETGGSHRLDISTTGLFVFEIEGLRLRWYFELEKRGANGQGHYVIDTEGVLAVLAKVYGNPRAEFLAYLRTCSEAVAKRGSEYLQIAEEQFGTSATLAQLATHNKEASKSGG
jgi:hypothetical protein